MVASASQWCVVVFAFETVKLLDTGNALGGGLINYSLQSQCTARPNRAIHPQQGQTRESTSTAQWHLHPVPPCGEHALLPNGRLQVPGQSSTRLVYGAHRAIVGLLSLS
jgi:hypothetical protein